MQTGPASKSEQHATLRSSEDEPFQCQPSPEQPISSLLPLAAPPPSTPPPASPHRLLTAARCGRNASKLEMDIDGGESDHSDASLIRKLGEEDLAEMEEDPDANGSEGLVERVDDLDGSEVPTDEDLATFWYESDESMEVERDSLVVSAKARTGP
jgi:hypothetical protein